MGLIAPQLHISATSSPLLFLQPVYPKEGHLSLHACPMHHGNMQQLPFL